MGGGFAQTGIHDWKMSALQQIGLVISAKYPSIEKSFENASQNTGKVNFENFKAFIEKHDALRGFNLTLTLLQKLFGEIDPHKKTYMTMKDWANAFQTFNEHDQLIIEYKNYLQCWFINITSVYAYYQTYGDLESPKTLIDLD